MKIDNITIGAPWQKFNNVEPHKNEKNSKKAAEDLEKMFFANIVKQLLPQKKEEGLFGTNSHAASMMKDMWIEAFSSSGVAKCLGLSSSFEKALKNNN